MIDFLPRLYFALDALWRRRMLVLLPALLMPVVGAVVGSLSPKQYRAHTSLLVQETAKLNPFLEDLAVSSNLDSRMQALKALLHSRHILTEVALEQGLMSEQQSAGEQEQIINQLSAALSVQQFGLDLIRIDYRAQQPNGMAELLSSVSKHFTEQLLAPERSSLRESERFLYQRLLQSSEELEQAEQALAVFRSENADSLPELHTANAERLAQIRQQLVEKQAALAGAKQSLGSINQQLTRSNPVLLMIEQQIIQGRSDLAALQAKYTDQHSQVQALKRKLRRLELERSKALEAPSTSTSPIPLHEAQTEILALQAETLLEAQQRLATLEQEVAKYQELEASLSAQIRGLGSQEQQLRQLNRNLKVKRQLHENLLTRYEMAQVTGALGVFEQSERIKIIDRPYTPAHPTGFPLWVFVAAGLAGGIALGISLVVVAELTDTSLRSAESIEQLTGLRVLSRIPPL